MAEDFLFRISQNITFQSKLYSIDKQKHLLFWILDKLKVLYEDSDGLRKEEIGSISGPNEFAEFYGRLRTIKMYHRKYPNEVAEPMTMEFLRYEGWYAVS